MAWPKGRPRPKKVGSEAAIESMQNAGKAADAMMAEFVSNGSITQEAANELDRAGEEMRVALNAPPLDWRKGALLNVRNRGDAYVITLYPEESHPERPERELRFTNPGLCQDFISAWYAAEHHDPRAR